MTTNSENNIPGSQKKPLTAGFELQTKIRLIIQEVLTATVRKLGLFGEKVQKFQEYFVTFKERFETGERERRQIKDEMAKITDTQSQIRREMNVKDVKYNEDKERQAILQKETKEEIKQIQKSVKTLLRQNQNINSQMSKTKSKFLQYSNTITTMKEQVSWKITKYLEETAESHTQMKVAAQDIKLQNFNMNLLIDKQKEKYDNIILKYEEDVIFRQETKEKIDDILAQNNKRYAENCKLNTKIDDTELALLSRIKSTDIKFQDKMNELDKNNAKLASVFKKIDNFNAILEGIKNEIDQNASTALNGIDMALKRSKEYSDDQADKTGREADKLEKKMEKNIRNTEQKIQKLEDFLLQKLEFVKMEIQSDLSSKTNKMLEQKSKTEQHLNSSTIEQINGKLSKFQFETTKNIAKSQSNLRQQLLQVKRQVESVKQEVQQKVEDVLSSGKFTPSAGHVPSSTLSSQRMSTVNKQLAEMKQNVKDLKTKVQALGIARIQLEQKQVQLRRSMDDKFLQSSEKLNTKVEKVMFLVTKMRGDSIIRNQFNDKEIRELKKNQHQMKDRMEVVWKIIPGLAQCSNAIMALIFDAQYQHSKIIQDNLPVLAKDIEKFNTCTEGVIYEFKERKKPGNICYRHNQMKKIDLVRATFCGFIQLWEQVFEAEVKNKQNLLPKTFFKRLVEKNFKQAGGKNAEKQSASGTFEKFNSVQQMRSTGPINEMTRMQTSDVMNTSFHIRKKKTAGGRQKIESMTSEIKQ